MNRLLQKSATRARRKARIRSIVVGTSTRPRLTVFISNLHVTAQIIDDSKETTLLYVSSASDKKLKGNLTEKATWVGSEIGKKAKTAKIKQVVFDRNGKLYHGRTKALADAARQEGLEF